MYLVDHRRYPGDVYDDYNQISVDAYVKEMDEISLELQELVYELYDDCYGIDPDIIHGQILALCEKLRVEKPNRKNLKIKL